MYSQVFLLRITFIVIVFQPVSLRAADGFECGIRKIGVTELILNGYDTEPGHWPWHAAVYLKDARSLNYACGGTLISNQFVLTAAHCVVKPNGYLIASNLAFVRLGVHDLDEINAHIQQHRVQEIYTTGKFTRDGHPDDIALLQLRTRANFDNYVQPACLNRMKDLTGKFGTAVGWGITEHDTLALILKAVQMPAVDTVTCIKDDPLLFANVLNEGIFCAGYKNGTTVCNGDSGGGLFFKQGNAWYLGGIISYAQQRKDNSNRCETHGYGAFTRIYAYLAWIKDVTKLESIQVNVLPEDCGLSITDRISVDHSTRVFAYPWMAKVNIKQKSGNIYYSPGTLINQRYVLTSGYVLDYFGPERINDFTVLLGEHTYNKDIDCNVYRNSQGTEIDRQCAGPTETFRVESIIVNPQYDYDRNNGDLGLIRMNRDVVMKDHIRPVCLPVTPQLRSIQFDKYTLVGWRYKNPIPDSQLEATAPWVNNQECQTHFEGNDIQLTAQHLCIRDQLEVPCVSRPGTPIGFPAEYNGVRFVQFAVKSYFYPAKNCSKTPDPELYTRVANHMDWILASIKP